MDSLLVIVNCIYWYVDQHHPPFSYMNVKYYLHILLGLFQMSHLVVFQFNLVTILTIHPVTIHTQKKGRN